MSSARFCLVVLLLVGCYSLDVTIQVNSQGFGEMASVVSAPSSLAFSGSFSLASWGDFDSCWSRGDTVFVRLVRRGIDLSAEETPLGKPILIKGDSVWTLRVELPSTEEPEVFGVLFGGQRFKLKVLVPGPVVSHNADRAEGEFLVWERPMSEIYSGSFAPEVKFVPNPRHRRALRLPRWILPFAVGVATGLALTYIKNLK